MVAAHAGVPFPRAGGADCAIFDVDFGKAATTKRTDPKIAVHG
jgi:hypothetical protein